MSEWENSWTRTSSKIARLPQAIRSQVDGMLSGNTDSMTDISNWLKEQGHDISRGAVGRYALQRKKVFQRMAESLEQTKLILEHLERNPDIDVSKAAQALMSEGLMKRVVTADEEFLEMPLDKAGRLLASFRRVNVAEKKLAFDMRKKMELALDGLELELKEIIKSGNPQLSSEFETIMQKVRKELFEDEN